MAARAPDAHHGLLVHSTSPDADVQRTKVLMLGLRRSGKTSIQEVVFNGKDEKQTFYLDKTNRILKHAYDTVIPLEIWDCPGNTTLETLGAPLSQFSTLIFVIDIQASYEEPIAKFVDLVITAYQDNPTINLEVFVHKSDTMSDQHYRLENYKQIQRRITDELADISYEYEQVPINFSLTSVYDHSIHEAFSRTLQRLIGGLSFLEDLLNTFCANSHANKVFLFDVRSRLFVATDSTPVDNSMHSWCCDYLKLLNSFGKLYTSISATPQRMRTLATTPLPVSPPPTSSTFTSPSHTPRKPLAGLPTHLAPTTPAASLPPSPRTLSSPLPSAAPALFYPSAAAAFSGGGAAHTLAYHLVTPHLALVAVLPTRLWDARRGLVEWNVVFFREGVREIWEVEWQARGAGKT